MISGRGVGGSSNYSEQLRAAATSEVEPTQCLPMHTALPIGHLPPSTTQDNYDHSGGGTTAKWGAGHFGRNSVGKQPASAMVRIVHYSTSLNLNTLEEFNLFVGVEFLNFTEFCLPGFDWPRWRWFWKPQVICGRCCCWFIVAQFPLHRLLDCFALFLAINVPSKLWQLYVNCKWSKTHSLLETTFPTNSPPSIIKIRPIKTLNKKIFCHLSEVTLWFCERGLGDLFSEENIIASCKSPSSHQVWPITMKGLLTHTFIESI